MRQVAATRAAVDVLTTDEMITGTSTASSAYDLSALP
jgi:hypothetical protein